MILKSDRIADLLEKANPSELLAIVPRPPLEKLRKDCAASIDLRLGRWFLQLRQHKLSLLDIGVGGKTPGENLLVKRHYVPFGDCFILHPRVFILGATLEWIRLPSKVAGYVVGKSSLGRRGLIIETAAGIHPGFAGCLTLEITNVGEIPIALRPGMSICQLFLHHVDTDVTDSYQSTHAGFRRPTLSPIELDEIAQKLASPIRPTGIPPGPVSS